MSKYLIIATTILIGVVVLLSSLIQREKKEKNRLASNQSALLEDVQYYKTKDSLSAASVERLQFTESEYKKYNTEQAEKIKSLGIKINRLQSVATAGTETEYEIETQVKDSLVMRDSLVTLKCIELHTPYLDVSGCIEVDRFAGSIITRDTLAAAAHRIPKRFWFIKYGTKAIQLELFCSNPNSQITYAQYVEIVK